ncbi:hypothetical protein G6F50_015468 [Rhizopus delemar]|uniref:Uncharacterized protein n=1 Tax=Rhizopus delemar TaxID=936053 RepID=A0A9P6XXN9_9FUNG|nr:hypothetical protein G6F50_015468 [Rhizopus delemar]
MHACVCGALLHRPAGCRHPVLRAVAAGHVDHAAGVVAGLFGCPGAPGGGHVGLVLATSSGGAARDLDQPLPTITTGGAGAERPGCARPQLVEPIIVPTSNTSSAGVPRSAAEPIRTVTTAKGGDQALAVPLVAQYYGATATAHLC